MPWVHIQFPETLERISFGRESQILSSKILARGRFPVIDQGQKFIAGYSNAEERVVRDHLPLVIFGDHTRCFKYVDFPFVIGADGTKVLKPKHALFDAKFYYYALLSLNIPNRGYNRHFTVLKETRVPRPEKSEQRKIAGVLTLVQRAMEQQERLLALTVELKKTLLHQLFRRGLRGERQKQTEIGSVPETWDVVKLEKVCSFQSGGTPSKQREDFWAGAIPWASPKDMKRPRLTDVPDHISAAALEDGSSLAPKGSIFVVIRGMILAKDVPVALAEVPMAFNQDMKAIIPGNRLEPDYLLYAMMAFKRALFQKVGRSAHGTMTLMSSELAAFQIPVPDKKTQREIARPLQLVEDKENLHRRKHAALSDLFRTLLHQLMTAQLRVHELDLEKLLRSAASSGEPSPGLRHGLDPAKC